MSERYNKIAKIGSGTFGEAFLVNSFCSGRSYVLKEVRLTDLTSEDLEKTKTEATVLARCKHANIIRYKESFITTNPLKMCLIMEYADAGDLHEKVKRAKMSNRLIAENQILHWFVQIIFAVQYLHSNHILHRDLKTQNIFLMRDNIVKVGDFGIAKFLRGKQDLATTAIGTPYYLSPEICLRKPYNYRSDMWAIGCILYELCALKHPFEASNLENLVVKILRGIYAPLSSNYTKLVHNLTAVLLRTNPEKRPTADDVLIVNSLRGYVLDYIKIHEQVAAKARMVKNVALNKENVQQTSNNGHLINNNNKDKDNVLIHPMNNNNNNNNNYKDKDNILIHPMKPRNINYGILQKSTGPPFTPPANRDGGRKDSQTQTPPGWHARKQSGVRNAQDNSTIANNREGKPDESSPGQKPSLTPNRLPRNAASISFDESTYDGTSKSLPEKSTNRASVSFDENVVALSIFQENIKKALFQYSPSKILGDTFLVHASKTN